MTLRRPVPALAVALAAVGLTAAPAAAGRRATDNFVVDAPTQELADEFARAAERYRHEKAVDWLGKPMPRWATRCPLKVEVTMTRTGGATTFTFGPDGVASQEMKIFGPVPQLLHSVLPHEVTHTVLAHRFGRPVPRWADEGGSVLSENDEERFQHDVKCREFLNGGRGIRLANLFAMKEYPRDMIVLYAQGYSVCQYLIDLDGGKKDRFLRFLEVGMQHDNRNWEDAVRLYNFGSTDDLQAAWLDSLKTPPRTVAARTGRVAGGDRPGAALTSAARGPETRSSAVPGLPLLDPPVVARGAAPDRDDRAARAPAPPAGPRLGQPEPPARR